MPSAKSHRVQVKKAAQNKTIRSNTRSRVTAAKNAVSEGEAGEATESAVKDAIAALDRAARKGIIHRNQAARKKSKLQKSLNSVSAS